MLTRWWSKVKKKTPLGSQAVKEEKEGKRN